MCLERGHARTSGVPLVVSLQNKRLYRVPSKGTRRAAHVLGTSAGDGSHSSHATHFRPGCGNCNFFGDNGSRRLVNPPRLKVSPFPPQVPTNTKVKGQQDSPKKPYPIIFELSPKPPPIKGPPAPHLAQKKRANKAATIFLFADRSRSNYKSPLTSLLLIFFPSSSEPEASKAGINYLTSAFPSPSQP